MFIARSNKYRLLNVGEGLITFERLDKFELTSVPEAKFVDITTGNVIVCKWIDGCFVAEYTYGSIRKSSRQAHELCDPIQLMKRAETCIA